MKVLKDFLAIVGVLATIISLGFVVLTVTYPLRAYQLVSSAILENPATPLASAPPAVEITRLVPVTVEITREVTVPAEIAVPVKITVPVEVTRVVPETVFVEVTREVIATPSPIPPTSEPAPTSAPDLTSPNTLLTLDETWRADGENLTLTAAELCVECNDDEGQVRVDWDLTNLTSSDLIVSYDLNSFAARDNLGNRLSIVGWTGVVLPYGLQTCEDATFTLPQQKTMALSYPCSFHDVKDRRLLGIVVNLADASVKEVIVTVKGISRIQKAEWRIPIPR